MIWKLSQLCVFYFAWISILQTIRSQTYPYNDNLNLATNRAVQFRTLQPIRKNLHQGIISDNNQKSNSLFIFKSPTPSKVFYPKSFLNDQRVQKPSSNLENKSIPELMSTLKNLIHKRKKTSTQLSENTGSLSEVKPIEVRNVRRTAKLLPVTKTRKKDTVPVLSLFEPSVSLTQRSPQRKTGSNKLQINSKAVRLLNTGKIISDSISNTVTKHHRSNKHEKTSHTIIIAQTANIMSHVGTQSNNQKSKTDVKGPVYVESKTKATNTHNTVHVEASSGFATRPDNTLKAGRNASKTLKSQPMRESKFLNSLSKETDKLVLNSSDNIATKRKVLSSSSIDRNTSKNETSKSILRRSLRHHVLPTNKKSGQKDPTAKAKAIWNSIKKKMVDMERKSKRDTSLASDVGKLNGNFDVLYSLVQMILAFKEYQDRQKQQSNVKAKPPVQSKDVENKLQITNGVTSVPVYDHPSTKPVRKSFAQSKISSALDLMAGSHNYISEPRKMKKPEDIRRQNVNNIMKNTEVIGSSLSNSARSFENKIHLQGFGNNGLKHTIVSQKEESKFTDFVLDPRVPIVRSQRKTPQAPTNADQNRLYSPSNQFFQTKSSFMPIYRFSTKSMSRDSQIKIGVSTQPPITPIDYVWQRTTIPPKFQFAGSPVNRNTIVPQNFGKVTQNIGRKQQFPQRMRQIANGATQNKRNVVGNKSFRVSRDQFARTTMQQKPTLNKEKNTIFHSNPKEVTFNFLKSRGNVNGKAIPNSVPRFSPRVSMFTLPKSALTTRRKIQNGIPFKPLNTRRHDFGGKGSSRRMNSTLQNASFQIKEANIMKPSMAVGKKSSFSYEQARKDVQSSNAIIVSGQPILKKSNSSNSVILASIDNKKIVNTINSNKSNVNQVVISNTNINNPAKTPSSPSGFNAPFVINSSKNVTIIHRKTPDGGNAYHIIQDTGTSTTKPTSTVTSKPKPKARTKKPIDIRDFDFEEPIDFLYYLYQ